MPYSPNVSLEGADLTASQRKVVAARDYANQIASGATKSGQGFPSTGQFVVTEEMTPEGLSFKVTHSETDQQYGQASLEREDAIHLMSNLNDQIVRRTVNRGILDSIDESPEEYSPEQVEALYFIGQKLNNPNRDTITVPMLNEAGGTTGPSFQENLSIDALHQLQYGVPPYTDKGEKIYKDLSNLTVAQKINFERVKKGLPEVNEFSLAETKEALGDSFPKVFDILTDAKSIDTSTLGDFGSVGARLEQSRNEYKSEKKTREDLISTLENKNITSNIASPEIQYIFKRLVNESDVSKMSPSQRAYLIKELSVRFPVLPQPASIPDFTPNPYTTEQYEAALEQALFSGDGSVENIKSTLGDVGTDKRATVIASAISRKLQTEGLVDSEGVFQERLLLEAPRVVEQEPISVDLEPYSESDPTSFPEFTGIPDTTVFEENFRQGLDKMGLGDVGVRVLSVLRNAPTTTEGELIYEQGEAVNVGRIEGYYKPSVKTVFLGIDRAGQILSRNQQAITPQALEDSMASILDHEMVHAVRNLDLWTKKEWESLERLAKTKTFPGKSNVTFFDDARTRYEDLSPVGQMEEAIAELIRFGRKDKRLITGKPRSLVKRMFSLFERLGNAIKGTGFNTMDQLFESTLGRLESGEIGARQRGEIRTLRATEKRMGAVPERGIGRERDIRVIGPQTPEEEIQASRIKSLAKEQEFDIDNVYYHATTASQPIKKFRSDLDFSNVPLDDVIAGHFTLNPEFANTFLPITIDERGARMHDVGDQRPAIYPVYLRAKNTFDAGEIYKASGDSAFARTEYEQSISKIMDGVNDLNHPFYEKYIKKWVSDGQGYIKVLIDGQVTSQRLQEVITDRKKLKRESLRGLVDRIARDPDIHYDHLEQLSPFIRSAGYDSYIDYENTTSEPATGIAILDPSNIKGVFAQYDPSGVPEGYGYADDIMFSKERGTGGPRRTRRGQYIGAPKGLDTPQKLGALRRAVKGLAEEGESGRFWYERSGKALLAMTGGDKTEAGKLAQAIAITSPQTPVPSNFNFAVQAYYQHKAGQPIKTGMYPGWMSNALENVFAGGTWEGTKTNNFYKNVMRAIDPSIDQGVTTDIWMMRAFGFAGDSPTDAQYRFVEGEVKKMADELGWEPQQVQAAVWVNIKGRTESKKVKEKTEQISQKKGYMKYEIDPKTKKKTRVITDPENHRRVWLNEAMKYEPTGEEKATAKFDYSDAARNNLSQISWESIPGRTSDHLSEIFTAPYPVVQDYHVQISKAFLDNEGRDIIAKELGVLSPGDFEAPGYFEGKVSPGTQTQIVTPKRYKLKPKDFAGAILEEGAVEFSAEDLVKAYAAVRGVLMKQDGVGYHRPFFDKSLNKGDRNAVEVDIGRPFTAQETKRFAEIMKSYSGHGEYNPIGSERGARLINFGYLETSNKDFGRMVGDALADMEFANGESWTAGQFAAQAGYLGNDWSKNKNGEGYLESLGGVSPDLQRRAEDIIRRLQPRINEVDREFSEKHGWAQNEEINRRYREQEAKVAPDANAGALEEIKEYRDETRAIDEAIQRTPEGSPLRSYIESNEKLQDDIAAYQSSSEPPLSFQTVSHPYGVLDKFVYNIADKFIGLQKVEDAINKGRRAVGLPPISTIDSAYAGEQSISGKAGNELTNFERGRKEPLAEKIAKSGLSREQVDEFLILRHAIERNNRIALRDPSRNPESTPGSGRLLTGELLTNSFVKRRMSEVYGLNWNDSSQSWEGGNSRTKNLSGIVEAADQIINETLDRSVQGGLLGREAAESIRSIYKYYAPLQGKHIEDDFAATMSGNTGKSYSVKGKEVLGALGRESSALSPLGNIITNAEKTISRSLNNKEFGQKLVSLIENNPNPDFWEVYSPKNPRYKRNFSRKYKYIGSDSELVQQTFTSIPPGMSKKDFIETIDFTPDRNTTDLIGVKIDGQQYYVDIKGDDRLREALVVSDSNSSGAIISTLGKVNRFLSMVNTQLNPEFIVGNFSRDIQTAVYNIIGEQDMKGGKAERERLVGAVLKDVMPSMGVFYKALRRYNPANGTFSGDQTGIDAKDLADWKEFMEAGAKADWFHTRPPEEQANTIDNMVDMANGTFTGNFRKRFKQVMDFVEDANSAVENAVRLSTFKAARDSFMDSGLRREEAVAKAADLAKNLTVNFNRKGMQGDLLNSIFLFFNASVQGTRNFARGLFGPNMNPFSPEASRRKQGMVAGLTLFSALLADMGEEESEINPETGRSFYSEIPDYIKERNLVIMADPSVREGVNTSSTYIGKDGEEYEGSQRYYLIPLPYGYNVFSYLGTALSDIGRGNMSVLEASSNLTSALLGSFSPVGISPLPTVAQPFVEIANNKNFFGSPIYKDAGMFGGTGPDSALSMRSTAAPFKFLAETANALTQKGEGSKFEKGALDVSPDTLEHLFEFAMGGAGKFGLRGGKFMGKIINGEEIELRETPFVRRIMGETDSRTSQADYYDRIGGLKNKETALKNLQGAERLSYRNANEEYIQMFYLMKNTETSLSKLRKRRKAMKKSADNSPLTAKAFAEYEEKFFDYEKQLYNRFNKQYDKILGRGK